MCTNMSVESAIKKVANLFTELYHEFEFTKFERRKAPRDTDEEIKKQEGKSWGTKHVEVH